MAVIHPVAIIAVDPPFTAGQGVLFGPQRGKEVDDFTEASTTTSFELEIGVAASSEGIDFKGPFVHGKKGDRFLYLSWGLADGAQPFVMFARAKLKLSDLPTGVLAALADRPADGEAGVGLTAELAATNAKGEPASGTIRPPAVTWRLQA